jgi:DNA polymerase/3'-5' exonuclease PolX
MELTEARRIAERCRRELAPYCERCEIAGSIRRCARAINDIELVVIPARVRTDLFRDDTQVHPGFAREVDKWERVKGYPDGRYTQRILPEGTKLDLFMADPDNWGWILAIRTGSANFSHKHLAGRLERNGLKSVEGKLWRGVEELAVPEEADVFELLGLDYIDPVERR